MSVLRSYLRSAIRPLAAPIIRRLNARYTPRSELEGRLELLEERYRAREAEEAKYSDKLAIVERALGKVAQAASLNLRAIHDLALDGPSTGLAKARLSVSVVVTTCDRHALLRRALSSLRAQTRRPDAVIVVNDGANEVSEVISAFADLNIKLLKTPRDHSGPSAGRNLALDEVNTDLVSFLDDDNVMWPSWVEIGSRYLQADSEIDLIYGAQLRDDEISIGRKFWLYEPFRYDALKRENFVDLNQLMHRASDCRFDEKLRRLVDWDYLLKFAARAPDRIVGVDTIASMYSTASDSRISVLSWPPGLPEVIEHRRAGKQLHLPAGHRACSCCGFIGKFEPGPNGRPDASCPQCRSLERHRFLGLLTNHLHHVWVPETRRYASTLIEIAPSAATAGLRSTFTKALTVDADPDADGRMVDLVASLTELPLLDKSCDAILVLHVLEHIREDRQAMREIARVLRPQGVGILQVPLSPRAHTDEEVLMSDADRLHRYGQSDHVRLYGQDYYSRLKEEGLFVVSISPQESLPEELCLKFGLLRDQALDFVVRSESAEAVEKLSSFAGSLKRGAL